ncbi:hypothetical protein M8542_49265 [Amycolatopsis sp. OK19-0408]|uniref:Uncharacterized protein n=1 Tax=Amycolatopsis iheyensis TaxID=2945988 RepID=A0A9X2NP54_9PSEU|nr:hypothetical protein [Amycolatopsis iheyensis]MCR6490805.1 hypothetical protein [Amycolatopsis iheyensis]
MKQAELRVGDEYAYQLHEPHDAAPLAARVRVVSIDGRGKATVVVVEPGPPLPAHAFGARSVKRNEKLQISTRSIACLWGEWAARAAAVGAEKKAQAAATRQRWEELDRLQADRLVVDPERALPDQYDEEHLYPDTDVEERASLCKAYARARRLGPYATDEKLKPLLVDLPVPVLRDIVAADDHRRAGAPGTVAYTFGRAAELLEAARVAQLDRAGRGSSDIPAPLRVLDEADVAFVAATREAVANAGGDLLLPPVPALPDWVKETDRAMAPTFGWLRLAVGDTDGERLHSPGCALVRSRPAALTEHVPWWQVMLDSARLCGNCGGPGVRDLVPLAGFVAAVDVWRDRGKSRIERWQQAAFQRLLSATAAARAQTLAPDITLTSRIVAALTLGAPGDDGWAAYWVAAATRWNRLGAEVERLTAAELESACALVRDRLTTLLEVLPKPLRPQGPPTADVEDLRRSYEQMKELLGETVPQLDRLLFTLPGAVPTAGW